MPDYFIDSSALAKHYRDEVGSRWVSQLFLGNDRLVVSRLGHLEVACAIVRRGRAALDPPQLITAALTALDVDVNAALEVIEVNSQVMRLAMDTARIHGLRGADAIQLACALLWRTPSTGDFGFISADDELNAAAAAEGLQVENPNLHP
jgi:predicted nucleic acid-binding protein